MVSNPSAKPGARTGMMVGDRGSMLSSEDSTTPSDPWNGVDYAMFTPVGSSGCVEATTDPCLANHPSRSVIRMWPHITRLARESCDWSHTCAWREADWHGVTDPCARQIGDLVDACLHKSSVIDVATFAMMLQRCDIDVMVTPTGNIAYSSRIGDGGLTVTYDASCLSEHFTSEGLERVFEEHCRLT